MIATRRSRRHSTPCLSPRGSKLCPPPPARQPRTRMPSAGSARRAPPAAGAHRVGRARQPGPPASGVRAALPDAPPGRRGRRPGAAARRRGRPHPRVLSRGSVAQRRVDHAFAYYTVRAWPVSGGLPHAYQRAAQRRRTNL